MQQIILYHGSGQNFDEFNNKFVKIRNDYYGGGIAYLIDSYAVARMYAMAESRKTSKGYVYRVVLTINKLFDTEKNYEPKEFLPLIKNTESFLRGAGLLRLGVDKIKAENELKTNPLLGKTIFMGLSRGGVNSLNARDILIKAGYDSLVYKQINGTAKIFIAYYPNKIRVIDKIAIK